ncbi:MAG: DNA internalization-related competence protein ComEC/Rec2 [Ignavibacteria bacterium]|nr:DNA internalization-related competence protein ComEC/Rec2 [Ignavibacteria bacterium]
MNQSLALVPRLPAVKIFFFLALGIMLSEYTRVPVSTALITAAAAALAAIPLVYIRTEHPGPKLLRLAACAPLLLCSGVLLGTASREAADTSLLPLSDTNEALTMEAVVTSRPVDKPGRRSFALRVESVGSGDQRRIVNARAQCACYDRRRDGGEPRLVLREGDRVQLAGKIASARPVRNPGGYDARAGLRRQGMTVTISTSEEKLRVLARDSAFHLLSTPVAAVWRFVREADRALFGASRAAIIDGLLLGDRGMIDDEVNTAMRDAGVIHVLSVSGLHVVIILSMIWIPLGRVPFRYRAPIALTLLWFYALLTGMEAPVARAAIAATVVILGQALQRSPHTLNSIAAAGVLILLFSPQALFQPGFQLSFAAAASVVLFNPRVEHGLLWLLPIARRVPVLTHALSLVAMTISAQAGTLPLLAVYFGQVSVVSLAANLIVVPLVFVVVACAVVGVLLSPLSVGAALLYAAVSDAALTVIVRSSAFLASLPGAVVNVPGLSAWEIAIYLTALCLLLGWRRRLPQRLAVTGMFCAASALLLPPLLDAAPTKPVLRVTALDVGQGDAILIETPAGKRVLIDTGPSSGGFDAGEKIIVPYLRMRGISTLDALVFTHPDDDHIGGAASVLGAVDAQRVVYANTWKPGPVVAATDSAMRAEGAQLSDAHVGDTISIDPAVRLYVLSAGAVLGASTDANNSSVMLLLRYGHTALLLPGDAEAEVEEAVAARFGDFLRCDVLKAGHHGSRTSSAPAFLDAARPGRCSSPADGTIASAIPDARFSRATRSARSSCTAPISTAP